MAEEDPLFLGYSRREFPSDDDGAPWTERSRARLAEQLPAELAVAEAREKQRMDSILGPDWDTKLKVPSEPSGAIRTGS